MNPRPLISVVIPVFNGEKFLGDAIQSVRAQNYEPVEILVVDDGSSDDTASVAAGFGATVRYHRQENAGAPAARNQGLAMAKGEIIAFLDADDLYTPLKLTEQMARLGRRPECEIVVGRQVYESLEGGEARIVRNDRLGMRDKRFSLQLGCALFRREVFDTVGEFNAVLRHGDDWDWFLRAREMSVGIVLHRDLVLRQRLHAANLTRQQDEGAKYHRLVFKLSLDRRRAMGGRVTSLPPLASFLEPLLSVVIPVRNGERHIAAAINSVLREEIDPIEIIVVDDGSTDRSAEIAESFGRPVSCLRCEARGIAAARNEGWRVARAPLVLHLDADDLVVPESIALRMAVFERDRAVDIVSGHSESFFSPELDAAARARIVLPDRPRQGHLAGASIVRNELLHRVGPLDERWRVGADMDWYARATEVGANIAVLPQVVLHRRIHGLNQTLTSKDEQVDRMRILKAALDRRRAAAAKPSS